MTGVIKRAPAKRKSEARVPVTIRLSPAAIKGIEREATKRRVGSRELMRDLLEDKFTEGVQKLTL